MIKIGLTGGIGSGKSSVARWFAGKGITVFDADRTVHELFTQAEVIAAIKQEFGAAYAGEAGVDRKLLGNLVFADHDAKVRLENIIHPLVRREMQKVCERAESLRAGLILFDIPLLYETGWETGFDEVWVVYVPRPLQIERIVARNAITAAEAEQRIAAQIPIDEKAKRADRLIDNSGSWKETEQQLEVILAAMTHIS